MAIIKIEELLKNSKIGLLSNALSDSFLGEIKNPEVGTSRLKNSETLRQDQNGNNICSPILPESRNFHKQGNYDMSTETQKHVRVLRTLHEDPRFIDSDPIYQAIFQRFLFLAAYAAYDFNINGNLITLQPGQLCYSYRRLAEACGKKYTVGFLRGAIRYFNKVGFLTHTLTHDILLITISKSMLYEQKEQSSNTTTNTDLTQTSHTKEEDKEDRYKKDHHPLTPSPIEDDDDFFKETEKIDMGNGVKLTLAELEECIKARGDRATVEIIIRQVQTWPGRKYPISDWVTTVKKWKIKNTIVDRRDENEKFAIEFEKKYEKTKLWKVRRYRDVKKEEWGLLFEGSGVHSNPIFIGYSSGEFKEKVQQIASEKNMNQEIKKI